MTPILSLKNISKTFRDKPRHLAVLKDIDLEIQTGEFFILLGLSGAGKSTLLRIMSGLEKDYTGSVGYPAGFSPDDMSFVFQQFALLPWLSVYDNVRFGLISRGLAEPEIKARVEKELRLLGLEKFARAHPRELSGGMRQRVGIARALVREPKIIFMDEPFSELDSFTAQDLRRQLVDIWRERKMTIVMVTHLIEEAVELADRIAVLTPRPASIGRIIHNSLPHPRNKRSPDFYALEDQIYALVKP